VRVLVEVYMAFADEHPALYQTLMTDMAEAEAALPKPLGHDLLWDQVIAVIAPTLYIYPESDDIDAVALAVKAGRSPSRAGLYWNAPCLKEIGSPKFWPKETLEPILVQYRKDHPAPPPRPTPICKGQ
jgi:hypothetical protein